MKIRFYYFVLLILFFRLSANGQDNCASPTSLCVNNSTAGTTQSATASGTDPALSCGDMVVNRSVWFTALAINNGTCTITVNNINNNPEIGRASCRERV